MIFVDTGPLLARYLRNDQHHAEATGLWRNLLESNAQLLTTNLVVAEFLTLLARRSSARFAAERGRTLYESAVWTVVRPGLQEDTAALGLLERYGPTGVGFVDCVSFAVMSARGIGEAFTFDRHYVEAGFETIP